MKLLLINPKFEPDYSQKGIESSRSIPRNLLCLGTYIKNKGHDVKILDMALHVITNTFSLQVADADVIGFTVMTAQIKNALYLSRWIKDVYPKKKIVWGGIHPTLFPEQTIEEKSIDYVVVGEGEESLLKIMKYSQNKSP